MEPGLKNALGVFHRAVREVPAYKDFLRAHSISPASIHTIEDFKRVPVMSKKEYLYKYPVHDLFSRGKIPPIGYASSGSSGKPTFWFRGNEQELTGAYIHEKIFKDTFGISKKDDTLVIICFSMGIWVAGNYTFAACRKLSDWGYSISTMTPGIEMEDIINILKKIAPNFSTVVLAGYPPFLMDVANKAAKEGIPLSKNTKFITAGDKFTEEWRDSLLAMIHSKDPCHSIVSIYGSADAGVLGVETPATIAIRRAAMKDNALREALFGSEPALPALFQYDPDTIFFEEENNELLFTTNTGTPLIRYNIRDVGRVVQWKSMDLLLKKKKVLIGKKYLSGQKFPFLIKTGRNDVAVTFYALNIYPENIKAGLLDKRIRDVVSGQFFAFNIDTDGNKKQKLRLNIELANSAKASRNVQRLIEKSVAENLIATNIEYRKLYATIGENASPEVKLFSHGDRRFHQLQTLGLIGRNGKKVKIFDPA